MADDIELQPRYSTREISGKCIKCLAEQEYSSCLRELLKGEGGTEDLEEKYEALVTFLKSPELKRLRDESEKYLAEGKDVKVLLHFKDGETSYEIRTGQMVWKED